METTIMGDIGLGFLENYMESTIAGYIGFRGIMENPMETTMWAK